MTRGNEDDGEGEEDELQAPLKVGVEGKNRKKRIDDAESLGLTCCVMGWDWVGLERENELGARNRNRYEKKKCNK